MRGGRREAALRIMAGGTGGHIFPGLTVAGPCVNAVGALVGGLGSADHPAWKSQLVPPRGLRLSRLPFRVCAAKALSLSLVTAAFAQGLLAKFR
jgi:hypothetical protein